jgi:hypothetical protein
LAVLAVPVLSLPAWLVPVSAVLVAPLAMQVQLAARQTLATSTTAMLVVPVAVLQAPAQLVVLQPGQLQAPA